MSTHYIMFCALHVISVLARLKTFQFFTDPLHLKLTSLLPSCGVHVSLSTSRYILMKANKSGLVPIPTALDISPNVSAPMAACQTRSCF